MYGDDGVDKGTRFESSELTFLIRTRRPRRRTRRRFGAWRRGKGRRRRRWRVDHTTKSLADSGLWRRGRRTRWWWRIQPYLVGGLRAPSAEAQQFRDARSKSIRKALWERLGDGGRACAAAGVGRAHALNPAPGFIRVEDCRALAATATLQANGRRRGRGVSSVLAHGGRLVECFVCTIVP